MKKICQQSIFEFDSFSEIVDFLKENPQKHTVHGLDCAFSFVHDPILDPELLSSKLKNNIGLFQMGILDCGNNVSFVSLDEYFDDNGAPLDEKFYEVFHVCQFRGVDNSGC